jgi:hypothetical protein
MSGEFADYVKRVAAAFPEASSLGFSSAQDLMALVESELGSDNDQEVSGRDSGLRHVCVRPRCIYHVVADSEAPSALTSVLLGLLLRADLIFKVPSRGLPSFEKRVAEIEKSLGIIIRLEREWHEASWDLADVVVVSGSDQTLQHFQKLLRPWQRWVGYGHKVSAGWVDARDGRDATLAERAVDEILAYRQSGCLSPQVYFCSDPGSADQWAESLAKAFRQREEGLTDPEFAVAARIRAARDRARWEGHRLIEGKRALWTVVRCSADGVVVGPAHGWIQVSAATDFNEAFVRWRGHWSALSVSPSAWEKMDQHALELAAFGFSRVCEIGKLQQPNLAWRHDGRRCLGDLVRWMTIERKAR